MEKEQEEIEMKVIKVNNYQEVSEKAAQLIAAQIQLKPDCVLGLATGSTPIGTYNHLIAWYEQGRLDFSQVKSINLDEYVGLDGNHDQSYRYFMNTHLFDKVNIDKANTYVPNGMAEDLEQAGKEYDGIIDAMGGIDMQLLGIGNNGHIGFNEPADVFVAETHEVKLKESTIDANERFFACRDDVPKKAITMGMRGIMQAKKVILIANGAKKVEIIEAALAGDVTPQIPASILKLHQDCTIIYCD